MSLRERIVAALHTTPRRFQVKGIRFIHHHAGRGLIADEMGLGKTLQAAGWLSLNYDARPAVIVCPATLKFNWQNELWNHTRLESEVASGMTPYDLDGDIWILNYDILAAWLPWLKKQNPLVFIPDECQKLMHVTSKRSKAADMLAKRCEHVIGLSGTPITSRPIEFFPILHMIDPVAFPSRTEYAFSYCNPKKGWMGRGWDFSGACNLAELHEKVSHLMIRRKRVDVLKELPEKIRTIIPIDITNRKEYNRASNEFLDWLAETGGVEAVKRAKGAEALVKLGALKRLAAEGKIKIVVPWVNDWMMETGNKMVLFAIHKPVIRRLRAEFENAVLVDGSVTGRARQDAVDSFQKDKTRRVFIGSKAAWEGVTLTAAPATTTIELGWHAAEHDQAESRVLRIGQTSLRVDAFYFIAKGTVEEKTWEMINEKRTTVAEIVDGTAKEEAGVKVQWEVIDSILKKGRLR